MLDARVFALSVLTYQDCVNVIIGGFVAGDRFAGSNIGEKVECSAESQIERDVTFAYRCLGV